MFSFNDSVIFSPFYYAVHAFKDCSQEKGKELTTSLFNALGQSEPKVITFEINNSFFIIGLLLISALFYWLAVILYKYLSQQPSINEKLISIVYEVHQISGSLNPSMESVKRCIQLLNQCPSLINHPMPPYDFTPFLRACWSGNTPLVRYMLQNKADLSSCLTTGETPFYLAAYRVTKKQKWDPSVINLLYSAGCELSDLTAKGSSALHQAARTGHITLTQWLLSRKAHLTLQPTRFSPYDIATNYRDLNHQSIACLLHTFCPEMVKKKSHIQKHLYTIYNS